MLNTPGLESGSLPDIHPGALPVLEELRLDVTALHTTLPASWGARADVLPSLQQLTLRVGHLTGSLPPEWAKGFARLELLEISSAWASEAQLPLQLPAQPLQLPAEWATSFQLLHTLSMFSVNATGTMPPEWLEEGSFPSLNTL